MIFWDPSAASEALPLIATPVGADTSTASLTGWVEASKSEWQPRLLRHGALLFRGFDFQEPEEFEVFAKAFSPDLLRYTGGASPRKIVRGTVYNSTEASKNLTINQHHEGAYLPKMPAMISFFCVQPATTGGRTPLTSARKVTARLPKDLIARFSEKGVLYVNRLHGGIGLGRSWQAQFETTDKAAAEAVLRDKGYEFEWRADGGLTTRVRTNAIRQHPQTGERLWIGQADHWHPSGLEPATRALMRSRMPETEFPFNSFYGDGSALDENDLELIREAIKAELTAFAWQRGDVLVCDNLLVSHGREPFEGDRRVLVALS
jgi:alpha-ketoglutarate-dependent taurine dioxygenase